MVDEQSTTVTGFEFDCIVYKVQSLADSGYRITLDAPEYARETIGELMKVVNNQVSFRAALLTTDIEKQS